MKKIFVIICVTTFSCLYMVGQTHEYRYEIGAYVGGGAKVAPDMFQNLRPTFGGIFRYKFNKRWSLKAEGGMFNLFSHYNSVDNVNTDYTNALMNLSVTAEFNFFDFEINEYNRYARRITPYIFAGIGEVSYNFTNYIFYNTNPIVYNNSTLISSAPYTSEKSREVSTIIPAGIGVKFKLAQRWNLNLQYTHAISFTDRLEGVYELSDIYNVKGTNFFNKDMLSSFTVGVTFDFGEILPPCHCK